MNVRGLFVTGTDTGVGKTQICRWLMEILSEAGLKVGICKPAVSGATFVNGRWVWDDVERLKSACRLEVPEDWIAPFRWYSPLAPPAAAKRDRTLFESGEIPSAPPSPSLEDYLEALDRWQNSCDFLIVEGVGGLLCPLGPTETVADLAKAWGRPILIVSRLGLGTLNHTLMTVECAERRSLKIAGTLLNQSDFSELGPAERSNPLELKQRLPSPVLGPLFYQTRDEIPAEMMNIRWERLVLADQER